MFCDTMRYIQVVIFGLLVASYTSSATDIRFLVADQVSETVACILVEVVIELSFIKDGVCRHHLLDAIV